MKIIGILTVFIQLLGCSGKSVKTNEGSGHVAHKKSQNSPGDETEGDNDIIQIISQSNIGATNAQLDAISQRLSESLKRSTLEILSTEEFAAIVQAVVDSVLSELSQEKRVETAKILVDSLWDKLGVGDSIENPELSENNDESDTTSPSIQSIPSEQMVYLDYVEEFLDNQKVAYPLDNRIKTINTYDVSNSGQKIFDKVSDVYDNALASIFFTVIGKPRKAADILNSWLRIYHNNDYKPLIARFNSETLNGAVEADYFDTGNNAWMGIAFCRYFIQYADDNNKDKMIVYYNAANEIMKQLHSHQCVQGLYRGYMGRPTNSGTQAGMWQSTEHNIDMYALGACLVGAAKVNGTDNVFAAQVRDIAGTFVNQMFDEAKGIYQIGTNNVCSDSTTINLGATPADAQSWRLLSRAEMGGSEERSKSSQEALRSEPFFERDADFSDLIGQDIFGVRFTDFGRGVQMENTGSALLSLNDFYGEQPADSVTDLRNSIKYLFDFYKGGGIPASSQSDPNPQARGGFNTGLSWSYFDWPHVASTVWSGLALAYQFEENGGILIGMNPFYPGSSMVPVLEDIPTPPSAAELSD
ncbi:MAG: hypothetical protein AB8G05_17175 [Oligoflexales bacterium]